MISSPVFTDYLGVTFAPDDEQQESPASELLSFLRGYFNVTTDYGKSTVLIRLVELINGQAVKTSGTVMIKSNRKFTSVQTSGRMLQEMRERGVFQDYLMLLNSRACTVTRLDATKDYYRDAVPVLKRLQRKYPKEAKLINKAFKTTRYLSERFDGKQSGSFYIGMGTKARVKAIVYDKQHERVEKVGQFIDFIIRYELKFAGRDFGLSLKDAEDPTELFWDYADPLLIKPDVELEGWKPYGQFTQWHARTHEPAPLAMQLDRMVDFNSDVKDFLDLVIDCGEYGIQKLEQVLARKKETRARCLARITEQDIGISLD